MSTDPNGNTNCSNLTDCYNCQNSSNCRPPGPLAPRSLNATLVEALLTEFLSPRPGVGCNRLNNCSNMKNSDVSATNLVRPNRTPANSGDRTVPTPATALTAR